MPVKDEDGGINQVVMGDGTQSAVKSHSYCEKAAAACSANKGEGEGGREEGEHRANASALQQQHHGDHLQPQQQQLLTALNNDVRSSILDAVRSPSLAP